MDRAITAAHLLSEASWLRRLAARLADDRDDADDLAQEAWIAAWQRRPDPSRSLRPWLAKVVRDAARMRRRATARRAARETAIADAPVATPEDLLVQARLHQTLVELVLALDEPYRATVLARYVEGRSAADIARTAGVPEGTVRWRLSEALNRLREQLDARARTRAWMPWLTAGGHALRATTAKTLVGAGIALAVLLACLRLAPSSGGGAGRGFRPPPLDAPIVPFAAGDSTDGAAATVPAPTWLTPADASTHAIAGRVVDERGAPIAGALVQLQSWPTGSEQARVTTRADGAFRFAPRWAATYVVTASAAAFASEMTNVDSRGPRGLPEPAQLVLVLSACTQTAEGTVTDAGGGPIAGATIQRQSTHLLGRFGPSVTSGTDGHYALCLPRGTSWLDIGADGYEHVVREVTAHDGRLRVDVALAPEAQLAGEVVDAATGEPIAGVWVGVYPLQRRSGEGGDRHAWTTADGRFTIDGLSAGRYMLTARDADHVKAVIDELDVAAARGARPLTIRMTRGLELRGHVRAAGRPLASARVELAMQGNSWGGASPTPLDVVTDADGAFAFHGVPPVHDLIPKVPGYTVHAPSIIDATAAIAALSIDVEPQPTLRGRVIRDGVAVVDAEVSARPLTSGPRITSHTDAAGAFEFPASPGVYHLGAVSARVGAFSTTQVTATVPGDAEVIIELDGGATITGTVRDTTGAPVVNAEVRAVDPTTSDGGGSVTAIDGTFSIDSLAGGTYELQVDPYVGSPVPMRWAGATPSPVVLGGGHAHAVPIALVVERVEGSIDGTVVDHAGRPIADAIVRLGPVRGWTTGVPIARTDADGHFHLGAVGAGPFTVDAGVGGSPLAVADHVMPGTTDLVLRLVRPGALDGTVVGLSGARIWARRVDGVDAAASVLGKDRTTQADGDRFHFDALLPGDYTLLAVTPTTTASAAARVEAATVSRVALTAGSTRTITGRVIQFRTGAPVAHDRCAAVPALGDERPPGIRGVMPQTATTADDGTFAIDGAPAGAALVVCGQIPGYSAGAAVVPTDGTATIEVVPVAPLVPGRFGFSLDETRISAAVDVLDSDSDTSLGITPGDRVVAVDGHDVTTLYQGAVYWLIAGRRSGSSVRITLDRDGARFERTVIIESTSR